MPIIRRYKTILVVKVPLHKPRKNDIKFSFLHGFKLENYFINVLIRVQPVLHLTYR